MFDGRVTTNKLVERTRTEALDELPQFLNVLACAHTNVDYALVQRHARAVLDAKNAMKGVSPRENIEVL